MIILDVYKEIWQTDITRNRFELNVRQLKHHEGDFNKHLTYLPSCVPIERINTNIMTTELKSMMAPLNGNNYATWKTQCKMALMKDGLWSTLREEIICERNFCGIYFCDLHLRKLSILRN